MESFSFMSKLNSALPLGFTSICFAFSNFSTTYKSKSNMCLQTFLCNCCYIHYLFTILNSYRYSTGIRNSYILNSTWACSSSLSFFICLSCFSIQRKSVTPNSRQIFSYSFFGALRSSSKSLGSISPSFCCGSCFFLVTTVLKMEKIAK